MAKKVDVDDVRIRLAGVDGRALDASVRPAFQLTEQEAELTGRRPGLDETEDAPTDDERLIENDADDGYNCDR